MGIFSVCTRPSSRGLCAPDFPGTDLVIATYLAKHLWTPPQKKNVNPLRVRYMGRAPRSARLCSFIKLIFALCFLYIWEY